MARAPSPHGVTRLGTLLRRVGRLLTRRWPIEAAAARGWMEIDRLA